jgi:hypothetical protein
MKAFEIIVRGDTLGELASNLLHIAKQYQVTPGGQDARPAIVENHNGKAVDAKPEPKKTPEKPSGKTPAKKAEVEAEAEDDTPALDYKTDIAPKVLAVAEKHGREAAEAVLLKFGVKRAPHLSPDQYPAVAKALDAALAD